MQVTAPEPHPTGRVQGPQQKDANATFQSDAALLAQAGYEPTTQSWAQGQWGLGAFIVAIALFIVLIGILVFIYMLLVKPDGTLTVTYARRAPAPAQREPMAAAAAATPSLMERLSDLERARAAGLLTDDEYAAERAAVIESH
jgi:hypothetical protein